MAEAIQISAEERRVLYLAGAFHADGDWLDHAFDDMHPTPVNGHTSTTPDRTEVGDRVDLLLETVALFDAIGWELETTAAFFALPCSLAPLLERYVKFGLEEINDHSAVLKRKMSAGEVQGGEWLAPDHEDRDTEDELLERDYTFRQILNRMEETD